MGWLDVVRFGVGAKVWFGVDCPPSGQYVPQMLAAGVFDDFKGATTLLLWGDREGVAALFDKLSDLHRGIRDDFGVEGPDVSLIVCVAPGTCEGSTLATDGTNLRWICSGDRLELACDLVEPLLSQAGHQLLDVDGLAQQVVIARDEYPADLR